MHIISALLLLATSTVPIEGHTLLRGYLPTQEPIGITNHDNSGDVLLGTSWAVTHLAYAEDTDGEMRPVLEDHSATVIFSNDNYVSGYAGCNQISGGVTITSSTLEFTNTMSTMMLCHEEGVMEQEYSLFAIFRESVPYEITNTDGGDQVLTLYHDETGEPVARLVPLPKPTLVGSEWEVNGVPHSLWMTDRPLTLSFDDESNFSGYGGCNTFSGEWEEVAEEESGHPLFRTKKMRVTRRRCQFDDEEQERGVMEQEQKFLGALRQDVVAYEIDSNWGGRLVIYNTTNVEETDGDSTVVHSGGPLVVLSKPRAYYDDQLVN